MTIPTTARCFRLFLAGVLLSLAAVPGRAADPRLKWKKDWGPIVPHKKFPKDCSLCHVPKRWDVLRKDFHFDHLKETGYPLVGAHADAACLRCHNDRGPLKAYVSRGCGGCHVDRHKGTLGLDCARCHEQTVWAPQGQQGRKLADHARTRFPLTGMHAVLQCEQCHLTANAGNFTAVPSECVYCHQKEFARAPNHAARGYSQSCQNCHTASTWLDARFNHAALGPNPVCFNCHAPDFQRAPNHAAQGYSQACLSCHTGTSTWLGANFDHSALGGSPNCYSCHAAAYTGAKATPASNHAVNAFPMTCTNCHAFSTPFPPPWGPGTAMQHSFVSATPCYNCHAADFQGAPNHVAQGFPQTCLTCHTGTSTWLGAVFDHSALGANPVCYNCHAAVYASARPTPASNHAANAFPTTCRSCHAYSTPYPPPWGPGTAMQHSFVTSNCASCHTADFNAATSPVNHPAQGIFASACATCHTNFTTWTTVSAHNPSNCATFGGGSHQGARCVQCHATPNYATASCTACHSNRGNSCN